MRRVIALALFLSCSGSVFIGSAGTAHALVWPDVPERVERGLASPDAATRRSAARELGTLGAGRATPLILRALADTDVDVRLTAAKEAVALHVAPATDIALQWLGERDPRLRSAACDVAEGMPNVRSVPALARALGDADPGVRASCADALGVQGSLDATAPLSGKLDDPTPAVRIQVARALAKLGDPRAVVPLVGKVQDSVPDVRQAVVRALGDLNDPRATQALLLAIRDNVPEVKVEALSSLGRLRAPDAAVAIAPLALERNPTVRQAALVALGRIGSVSPDAVRALIKVLGLQDDALGNLERNAVRDALVAAGPVAVPELTALLERPISPAVATSAAWVLGELRATSSAPMIVAALRKGTLPSAAALRALAGAGTADQVPVVLEFVADPSPVVRDEALRAATALLDPSKPDGRAVEPLAATLRSPRTSVQERASVAKLLGRTGAPRAAVELAGLVSAKDPALRLAAIDALGALGSASPKDAAGVADDTLTPLLADSDPSVRLHTAMALGSSGGEKAKKTLAAKLDGGEELDRYALLAALGGIVERLPDEATANRLFRELGVAAGPERDAVLEAGGRARIAAGVRGLERAATGDVDDRRMVATMLGGHRGAPAALALAKKLATDSDSAVRANAAFALGALGDASLLATLDPLTKDGDANVATSASGAMARIAEAAGPAGARAIVTAVCPMLGDGRSTVRANALVALAFAEARCGDGQIERKLLAEDATDFVRAAAARALTARSANTQNAPAESSSDTPRDRTPSADRAALDHCVTTDRSADVARLCRSKARPPTSRNAKAVTIFIVGESGAAAKAGAPYLLEYEGGILRAGVADRRGATFEPAAPAGTVTLRRPPLH